MRGMLGKSQSVFSEYIHDTDSSSKCGETTKLSKN